MIYLLSDNAVTFLQHTKAVWGGNKVECKDEIILIVANDYLYWWLISCKDPAVVQGSMVLR